MITPLRHRKPDAYTIAPGAPPRYHALVLTDDSHLLAAIYASDGTWRTDRGSIPLPAEPPAADNGVLLAQTGTLAWRSAENELTVWDPTAATTHTYQTAIAANCSPPVHHDGRLVWVEFPDQEDEPDTGQATFTLRHAATDLTNPQTLATVVFSALVQSYDLGPAARVAAGADTLLFQTTWKDNINDEVADAAGASFPFDPTPANPPTAQDGARLDLAQGFLATGGEAVGLSLATATLRAQPLTLGAPTTPRWPITGPWELAQGQVLNAAVTANGTTALLYGYPPQGDLPLVLEAPTTATAGQPAARTPIANHPVHGVPPFLLFFLE